MLGVMTCRSKYLGERCRHRSCQLSIRSESSDRKKQNSKQCSNTMATSGHRGSDCIGNEDTAMDGAPLCSQGRLRNRKASGWMMVFPVYKAIVEEERFFSSLPRL